MAIDAALLQSLGGPYESGRGVRPTLRFYTWQKPTLSLGYFQRYLDAHDHFKRSGLTAAEISTADEASTAAPVALVRRASGGGAIMHDHELTYSLAMPASRVGDRGASQWLYRSVHTAIADVIGRSGVSARSFRETGRSAPTEQPFLCFHRRTDEDLIVAGYKVLGSAQRRGRDGILQHGSLLIRSSRWAEALPGLLDLGAVDAKSDGEGRYDGLANALALRMSEALGMRFEDDSLQASEEQVAAGIAAERFGNPDWLRRR